MIGEKIKNKRKELNFTQEYLAKELGISRQAVSKWEKGLSESSMDNLVRLSEIFGVDIEYFKTDNGETENNSPISKIFWNILYVAIGLVFYLIYYFAIMEGALNKDPKQMPFSILTFFLALSVITFPQAVKDMGSKLDDIDYFTFSKLILPVIFIISPFIVFYYIFKKEEKKID
ncbi:helix-turn-helix domain-containing protein [uncultured Anaerococcus sp.]|uniref:helix-turn-helix domain-containing protein n=1 Tax=uncultured Anaerococcus sp. TaxID=293428 RepID=UPI00261ED9AC|nr:helix-turn-helix transcriptional regulator [uncultured Anaerococcus sp.]